MDHIVLNRTLVREAENICCFGIVDAIGVPRRSLKGTLSFTFRGEDNFIIRGVCPEYMESTIVHGEPVLIYANVTRWNNFPLLLVNQLQTLSHEQKEFVRNELEKGGVGMKSKKFGLDISSGHDFK